MISSGAERRTDGSQLKISGAKQSLAPVLLMRNNQELELYDVFHAYEDGKLSGREAADKLQISTSTFYRRYREYKKTCQ